jgi:hypothetical protein
MANNLDATKALIFRITHIRNVEWILSNGLHCRNSDRVDPNYVEIGNPELIGKRHHKIISIAPGGTLSDYIPFYFTPYSPMLLNIKTGWGGIQKRSNDEIVILVSSLRKLKADGVRFIFSDRHAYLEAAEFFGDLGDLHRIDWSLLQQRDFKRDVNDPGKVERYQAEALIYGQMPLSGLTGIVCYDATSESRLRQLVSQRIPELRIVVRPKWYF